MTLSVRQPHAVLRLCAAAALLAVWTGAAPAAGVERWLPLTDVELTVTGDGNPLDLSSLVAPGPAGQHGWAVALDDGHIGFETRRSAQRFLCASTVFSTVNGGLPDKAGAERLVEQLRKTGYGLVRLHFIDAQLMTARRGDFDFDPVQLDRLHYLLARLKSAGLYWIVDGLTSDNGAYGDVNPHRYVRKHQAKLDAVVSADGFAHWATLVERLWAARNPYTGMSSLGDPAMLGMILVNEGGIAYQATVNGGRYSQALAEPFLKWLQERYGTQAALRAAWGGDLAADESIETRVALPASVRGSDKRDIDFARFLGDLERDAFRRMDAHVRTLGFRGLTTAFDNWGFINADLTRAVAGWVDMHSYHVLPSNHGQPGSKIAQTSVHTNVARYVRELTNARQWGKPFTVTEYGQPFWNQWRHESAALLPAVAAHQGWDAICQFAEAPIQDDYRASAFVRRRAIYPYGVGADPIARAGERLAAMLFLRGDVAPARGRLRLHVDAERALVRNGGWEQVPEGLSRLALVTAAGLDFTPLPPVARAGELSVDLTGARPLWLSRIESALVVAGVDSLAAGVAPLKAAGIVPADHRSRPQDRFYQSDTAQLTVDSGTNQIAVDTPRTAVLVVRGGSASAGALEVRDASGPGLFALSSLDGAPLGSSRRMLLWVLTDAINKGMEFDDAERTTLRATGSFPPLVRAVSATVRFKLDNAAPVRVWALSMAGTRRTPVVSTADGATALVRLDTAALSDGPALFFEIVVE